MSDDLTASSALHPLLAEAVQRGDLAYGAGGDPEAVAMSAAAPLLHALLQATARAEAAEATIRRVRDLAAESAFNAQDIYGDLPGSEYDDQDNAESLLAVTVRALTYALDTTP